MTNTATSGKKRNRYFQVNCLNRRGYAIGRIFFKADNIAQVRHYLDTVKPIYQNHVKDLFNYGVLSGSPAEDMAVTFKVFCVCHLYAKYVANGGYDLQRERTSAERRHIVREIETYLFNNTTPLPQYYINNAS